MRIAEWATRAAAARASARSKTIRNQEPGRPLKKAQVQGGARHCGLRIAEWVGRAAAARASARPETNMKPAPGRLLKRAQVQGGARSAD